MNYLGLDIGTTAIKWALCDQCGVFVSSGTIQPEEIPMLCQQLSPTAIGLTGVGAGKLSPLPYPCQLFGEFDAIAMGTMTLAQMAEAVVVSLGTGTAFLHAKQDGTFRHLCGTGIGGGAIAGLSQCLAGATTVEEVNQLSLEGQFSQVDLTMAEVTDQLPPGLTADMTAANFARIAPTATKADYVSGAINLVLHAVGTMALMACQITNCRQVLFVGSTTQVPPMAETWSLFHKCYGIPYDIPPHAPFATAYGAALLAGKKAIPFA